MRGLEFRLLYDVTGVPRLVESFPGLELLDFEETPIDIGWTKGQIGRFLVRKTV